jgi:hypothetical protein
LNPGLFCGDNSRKTSQMLCHPNVIPKRFYEPKQLTLFRKVACTMQLMTTTQSDNSVTIVNLHAGDHWMRMHSLVLPDSSRRGSYILKIEQPHHARVGSAALFGLHRPLDTLPDGKHHKFQAFLCKKPKTRFQAQDLVSSDFESCTPS